MPEETNSLLLKTNPNYRYLRWAILVIVFVYILIESQREGDFWVFLSAAKRLQEGCDIYGKVFGDGYHFLYGTLFALVLIPFTYLHHSVINVIWLSLDVFFIVRIWKIVQEYLDTTLFSRKQYLLFFLLGWAFSLRFLYNNFHVIQMTIFMVYASLESITMILKDRKIAGAALLALAINVKTLPIVLVPYLLYRNEKKVVVFVLLFLGFYFLLPAFFIGFDYNWFLLRQWFALVNPSRPIHVIDIDETGFHSLSAWLPTLLMDNTSNNFTLPLKRNILNLDYRYVAAILTTFRIVLVSCTIYFLRTFPFKQSPSKLHTFWEVSYILLLIPLVFPHQHIYAFFFLFPAGIYIIYFLMAQQTSNQTRFTRRKCNAITALLIFSFLLLSIGGIIGNIDDFTQHYKFITYGSLLLIIPLALSKPQYLSK